MSEDCCGSGREKREHGHHRKGRHKDGHHKGGSSDCCCKGHCCFGGHYGHHQCSCGQSHEWRRFESKREKREKLEEYKAELEEELQAVKERIEDLS